ncbi:MAG: PEP-CTERM sorting domain-containing protein [Edaphobacter sp.]
MHKLFSSLALVAALAAPSALHASMMTGQFSVQGTVTNNPTNHVLTFIPESVETGFGTQTGTFATLLTNYEHATAGTPTIAYDPYVAGGSYFVVGPLTATIDSLIESTSILNGQTIYGFTGMGTLAAAGYDMTPGSFTFSTQESGAVTFSATALATSPVPEPSSLALFGTGVFGLAGIVSRKFRA